MTKRRVRFIAWSVLAVEEVFTLLAAVFFWPYQNEFGWKGFCAVIGIAQNFLVTLALLIVGAIQLQKKIDNWFDNLPD